MKKFSLLFLFLVLSVNGFAQYKHVSIKDLQYVSDERLQAGDDKSSFYKGDTVTVTGIVVVPPVNSKGELVLVAGTRLQAYIVDTAAAARGEWAGMNIMLASTDAPVAATFRVVDTTEVITVSGVIDEYNGQTQLNLLPNAEMQIAEGPSTRPEPVEVTIADLQAGDKGVLTTGEKFEDMYVIIKNVSSSDRNSTVSAAGAVFYINDGKGNKIQIFSRSRYFQKSLNNYVPPADGSTIEYVKGIIFQYNNVYEIVPVYPEDVKIGASASYAPEISNIRRDQVTVGYNQPVKISAKIKDIDGTISEAKVFYHINGGASKSAVMTKNSPTDSIFTGTIDGLTDSSLVDYYIRATDNMDISSINPRDTVKGNYFYLVLNRPLTIQDVQYSPFGSGYSAYNNYHVSISGIVTADTSTIQGDGGSVGARVYMQNGKGPWSGIWLYGTDIIKVKRGDNVTVEGVVLESNNNTRIDSIKSYTVNSSGNALPEAVEISTKEIDGLSNGVLSAEKWEGVLVKYNNIVVKDVNADGDAGPDVSGGSRNYGEITVADTSDIATRVELQEGVHSYHNLWNEAQKDIPGNIELHEGDIFKSMTGILWQSFSNYKIVPQTNADFTGYSVDVNDKPVMTVSEYALSQNYPNPFNPSTTISYSIGKSGLVTLKVFNILGQEVKTLFRGFQEAGSYNIRFDASQLPTGIYLYQLNSGSYSSVKKMMLVK